MVRRQATFLVVARKLRWSGICVKSLVWAGICRADRRPRRYEPGLPVGKIAQFPDTRILVPYSLARLRSTVALGVAVYLSTVYVGSAANQRPGVPLPRTPW